MDIDFDEEQRIKIKFREEYTYKESYMQYLSAWGFRDVNGERCLVVDLVDKFPENLILPWKFYEGKKIVYREGCGRMKAHSKFEEAENLAKEFDRLYIPEDRLGRYSDYIASRGLSHIGIFVNDESKLDEGESLEDWCLDVALLKELPEDHELPRNKFKDKIRVFYHKGSYGTARAGRA